MSKLFDDVTFDLVTAEDIPIAHTIELSGESSSMYVLLLN